MHKLLQVPPVKEGSEESSEEEDDIDAKRVMRKPVKKRRVKKKRVIPLKSNLPSCRIWLLRVKMGE